MSVGCVIERVRLGSGGSSVNDLSIRERGRPLYTFNRGLVKVWHRCIPGRCEFKWPARIERREPVCIEAYRAVRYGRDMCRVLEGISALVCHRQKSQSYYVEPA